MKIPVYSRTVFNRGVVKKTFAGRLYEKPARYGSFSCMYRLLLCGLLFFAISCASPPNPVHDRVPGLVVTRRDILDGKITIILNGKSIVKLSPMERWGQWLQNGRYSVVFEYRDMRSRQVDFVVMGNRIELDIWGYINSEPLVKRRY